MESENSSQISRISLEGLNLPLSSQELDELFQLNSQDMLNVTSQELAGQEDQNGTVDFLELNSQQMRELIPGNEKLADEDDRMEGCENNEDAIMNSVSDEELMAAVHEFTKKLTSAVKDSPNGFQCPHCEKKFKVRRSLNSHILSVHKERKYPCEKCGKEFTQPGSKTRHQKLCRGAGQGNKKQDGRKYSCENCNKEFGTPFNKSRHEKTCQPKVEDFVCQTCGKRCSTKTGLKRHLDTHQRPKRKNEENIPGASKKQHKDDHAIAGPSTTRNTPTTFRCRQCGERFDNRRELYVHGMRTHYQVGQGLQPRPWGNNPAPWEHDGNIEDQQLREVYETNQPIILEQHQRGPIESRYNLPVENDVTVQQITNFVDEIYQDQQYAFRINLNFGMILQNRETGEYRYFTPYSNFQVLDEPLFISRRPDLRKLQRMLQRKDILNESLRNRPDTKWVPVLLTNIVFRVTSTYYPIGEAQKLPDYVLNKRSLYALVKNMQTGRPYEDRLCAFRCLALHREYDIESIEGPTKVFYKQWIEYKKPNKQFHGVSYDEFPNVNLEVYSLQEDDSCRSVYKSRGRFDTTMYVNLYKNHLSYIINFPRFAKKFQCETCERHFYLVKNHKQHQKNCSEKTKYIYPGKFFKMPQTLFEKLDEFGIVVPEEDRIFPWFICYDFESVLQNIEEHQTEMLQWTRKHIPISLSLCSNVPDYTEPVCIVEANQDELVKTMVEKMKEISNKVRALAEEKWSWVDKAIKNKMNDNNLSNPGVNEFMLHDSDKEDQVEVEEENNEPKEDKPCKKLERLRSKLEQYMTQVPILGFNSANYDLNLIKQTIAKHLKMHDKDTFTIKKNNSYTCLSSPELKFLDISQFLAQGASYASFLKAYQVEENKGYFPYEWFDDVAKLDYPELPPHEAFYSTLKRKNITKQEYEYCQKVWSDKNMGKFQVFLIWYNNLDVQPFVTAVERLQQFYFKEEIDVFKTAISVPGIARQMLFKCAKQQKVNFALFDKNNKDLYDTIKQNIVGGPSIIFKRHAQAGVTKIRGGKLCQSVQGFDANSLYLKCLGMALPTGPFIRRIAPDFKPEIRDRFMAAYYWMEYVMHNQDVFIVHELNSGKEVIVGKYPVDGFQVNGAGEKPTVYQFHGCYFHGHLCSLTQNIKDKKWLETREQKFKKTQEITKYLKDQECQVIEKWECEFRTDCRNNPEMYKIINSMRPNFFQKHRGKVNENDILQAVVDEELFGMIQLSIEVPQHWSNGYKHDTLTPYEYFAEMSPLFCTMDIPFDQFGEHMQNHVETHNLSKAPRRLLVGGMKAEKILLATPLLKWYLEHGLIVTKIFQVIEFDKHKCFADFVEKVSNARREGDRNPDTAIIADTTKVIGNGAYGSLIMDKTKHRKIMYVQGENETCLKVNDPQFRKLECLDAENQYYELEMAKKIIRLDLPIQLGFFILQYAKLLMLSFYYDFMDKYVDRSDFEYCEMDTDSAYMAISAPNFADVIKDDMRAEYQRGLTGFCNDEKIEADGNLH